MIRRLIPGKTLEEANLIIDFYREYKNQFIHDYKAKWPIRKNLIDRYIKIFEMRVTKRMDYNDISEELDLEYNTVNKAMIKMGSLLFDYIHDVLKKT